MSYSVVPADLVRDRETILDVWRRNIFWCTNEEHERRLDWYQHNPCGPTRMFLARHNESGQAIGTFGIVARHICIQGEMLTAGCVADMAVNAEHRSLQPALHLAEAVTDCLSLEMPLLWGYPNQVAAGVVRRVGFHDEGQGETYTRRLSLISCLRQAVKSKSPVKAASIMLAFMELAVLEPLRKSPTLRFLSASHPALKQLLGSPRLRAPSAVVRTPEFLSWVYEHSPYRKYVLLGSPAGSGQELRCAAFCYAKGGIAYIDDLVYQEDKEALEELFSSIIHWARAENTAEIRMDTVNADRFLVEVLLRFNFIPHKARPLVVLRHSSLPPDFRLFGRAESEQVAAQEFPEPLVGRW